MNKKLLIFGIAALLICIGLSGCFEGQSSEEQHFVGTWDMEGMETTITFSSNGAMSGFFVGDYEVKDDKLVTSSRYAGTVKKESYNYTFSNNDTRLILIHLNTKVIHTLIKQ